MTRKTIKNEFGIYYFFSELSVTLQIHAYQQKQICLFQFVIFNAVDKNVISVGTCIKATQNRIKIHVIYVHVCISPLKKCVIFSLQVYHQQHPISVKNRRFSPLFTYFLSWSQQRVNMVGIRILKKNKKPQTRFTFFQMCHSLQPVYCHSKSRLSTGGCMLIKKSHIKKKKCEIV